MFNTAVKLHKKSAFLVLSVKTFLLLLKLEIDRYGFFYNRCRCLEVRVGRYVLPIFWADFLKFSLRLHAKMSH